MKLQQGVEFFDTVILVCLFIVTILGSFAGGFMFSQLKCADIAAAGRLNEQTLLECTDTLEECIRLHYEGPFGEPDTYNYR